MLEKLISVIVPVYKVEKYLNKCVESLVNQSYKNLEIILVDDGSPDNCPQICDEWAKKDNRIKVLHKKNGGLSDARNAGIEVAKGDFLVFQDSDDYVDYSMCEKLYNLLTDSDADFAMCDAVRFDENETPKPAITNPQIKQYEGKQVLDQLKYADSAFLVIACGKLYKREIFKEIRYPVSKLHEDVFMLHHVLGRTTKFVYTNEQMYYYLQRSSSITGKYTEKNYEHILQAYKDRYEYLKTKQDLWSEDENKTHFIGNLRSLYCNAKSEKFTIQYEIWDLYKKYYSQIKNKSWKDVLFRRFNLIYRLIYKIKGN